MSAETLLPCPFCGGAGEPVRQKWSGREYHGVSCVGDCLTFFDCRAATETEAIDAWNRRTPPATSADHIGDATNMVAPAEAVAWRFRTADRTFGQPGPWAYGGGPIRLLPGCYEMQPLYAHPPQPDALPGDLRERVARICGGSTVENMGTRPWDGDAADLDWSSWQFADAILALIQTERAGPRVSIRDTTFHGNNANGLPVFGGHADGIMNITLHGWTCFGPDEAGQKALAGFQTERVG